MRKFSPPTGIRSPDRPARSESLYRLSYPGPPAAAVVVVAVFIVQEEDVNGYTTYRTLVLYIGLFTGGKPAEE